MWIESLDNTGEAFRSVKEKCEGNQSLDED